MNVSITARSFGWAEKTFGYKWADAAKNPGDAMPNLFAIQDALAKAGVARAKTTDANSLIYMSKANQLYRLTDDEVKGIKARILYVPAVSDEISRRSCRSARPRGSRRRAALPKSRSSKATAATSTVC
jgi:homoserine acetyltransferase